MILETDRLILRPWADDDLAPFAALSADPEVMRYYPSLHSSEQTAKNIARYIEMEQHYGLGKPAVVRKSDGAFIGAVGFLMCDEPSLPFHGQFEIGWRLAKAYWGQGYATEAATAMMDYAFHVKKLEEIIAFTIPINTPSRAVMERLGMTYDPADDFEHPSVPEGHAYRPHVLYRKRRPL